MARPVFMYAVLSGAGMTVTRRTIRRNVLKSLGDLRVLTATRNGTDVTFYDTRNLIAEPGAYRSREIMFVTGTAANIGEIRYVTGSSQTDRSIGWGVALPASTALADEAELINTRGVGYRFDDVHDAINQAIQSVRDQALVPTASDDETYVRGVGIAVPANFRTIEEVQWLAPLSDTTRWRAVNRASRINGHGWWVDPTTRTVVVGGSPSYTLDAQTVRVWGLTEPTELFTDAASTSLDSEWLTLATQAILTRGRFMRMPTPEVERLVYTLSQEAARMRQRTITRRSPFSVELP